MRNCVFQLDSRKTCQWRLIIFYGVSMLGWSSAFRNSGSPHSSRNDRHSKQYKHGWFDLAPFSSAVTTSRRKVGYLCTLRDLSTYLVKDEFCRVFLYLLTVLDHATSTSPQSGRFTIASIHMPSSQRLFRAFCRKLYYPSALYMIHQFLIGWQKRGIARREAQDQLLSLEGDRHSQID